MCTKSARSTCKQFEAELSMATTVLDDICEWTIIMICVIVHVYLSSDGAKSRRCHRDSIFCFVHMEKLAIDDVEHKKTTFTRVILIFEF
jgi:hypothetical protein